MSKNQWHTLFLTSSVPFSDDTPQAVADELYAAAESDGYTRYNPFGLIPGRSYPHTVRAFVSPITNGWIRVIAASPLPDALHRAASVGRVLLALDVTDTDSTARVFADGAPLTDPTDTLAPFLREGATPDELRRALHTPDITVLPPEPTADAPQVQEVVLPLDALPPEFQEMASGLNPQDTQKLFDKMMGQVGKRGVDDQREAAQTLMQAARELDWNAHHAARIRLLMGQLAVPQGWREPHYIPLRDAYSLHARRKRRPNARLYPGDAEAMAAVPDALAYHPVFAGKDV